MTSKGDSLSSSLTLIVPAYNEELVIDKFLVQLSEIVHILEKSQRCTVLIVNNGSTDATLEIILDKQEIFQNLQVLTLTRNFGYETALIAGLTFAKGDHFAFCDSDGEDPVTVLPKFQESLKKGNQIAIGVRMRRHESTATRVFRRLSYFILSKISDDPFLANAGNFSMFTSQVREAILRENNSFPFLRSTFSRTGFKMEKFPHNRNPRIDGRSKYRKLTLLKFAIAGFMTTTTWPLRAIAYFTTASFLILIPGLLVINLSNAQQAGSIFRFIAFVFCTEIMASLSVIGLYLARIYKNSLVRPLFYVDWDGSHNIERIV